MLPVDATITRVRRDLTLSILLKAVLACAAIACFTVAGPDNARFLALLGIASVWVWLSINSARSSRAAAQSPSLIAAGQFEEAERNIEQSVKTFSLIRTVKLQSLHHLALLRHAQRRWQEAAIFARALLSQRLGPLQPLSRSTRLLLADSLLEMNDLRGAYEAIATLHTQPMSLMETLNLMSIQLDYSARVGGWASMVENVMGKVQFAELLPAPLSARSQALLALAAKKIGRDDLSGWLRDRAALLADTQRLVAERPMLGEVFSREETAMTAA